MVSISAVACVRLVFSLQCLRPGGEEQFSKEVEVTIQMVERPKLDEEQIELIAPSVGEGAESHGSTTLDPTVG